MAKRKSFAKKPEKKVKSKLFIVLYPLVVIGGLAALGTFVIKPAFGQ